MATDTLIDDIEYNLDHATSRDKILHTHNSLNHASIYIEAQEQMHAQSHEYAKNRARQTYYMSKKRIEAVYKLAVKTGVLAPHQVDWENFGLVSVYDDAVMSNVPSVQIIP